MFYAFYLYKHAYSYMYSMYNDDAWFDYNIDKVITILSQLCNVVDNLVYITNGGIR